MNPALRLRGLAAATGVALVFASANAAAFCRSRTCEQSGACAADENGCIIDGLLLYRSVGCVSFSVQEDASPRHGIDSDTMDRLVQDAFDRWTEADCGGESPSIRIESFGPVECDRVEYSSDQGNANVILFHNEEWPEELDARAFALTTVSFETRTGEIYDADMEINAAMEGGLSFGEPEDGTDLPSILTHEVGHFLGLAHSLAGGAVMRPSYAPMVDNLRVLGEDDVDGICAVYPPDREVGSNSCEPRHGFASACASFGGSLNAAGGCSFSAPAPSTPGSSTAALALVGLGAAMLFRRRRRSAQARGA